MTSTYALVLALEAGVVAVAGFTIAVVAWRRRDVVLYATPISLLGLGLGSAGVATVLLAFDRSTSATVLMSLAAVAYVVSGWNIAVDAVTADESFATEQLVEEPTGGFEDET